MKITFLGAAKTVTGSCFHIEAKGCKFLVDCGMFQGHSKANDPNLDPFAFNPSELDFILLTHAHIDHSGRIPKLFVEGFNGQIVTTKASAELSAIMLPDSGHIQEFENEWTNRKRQRAGKPPIKPLYTYQDAVDCQKLFRKVSYDEVIKLNDVISVKFNDAGHLLGSSIIEVWANEDGKETKVVFSGDLGNRDMPILRDRTAIESADFLVVESTYGNKLHKDNGDRVERFVDIINETIENGGNVVIPSFAVGRTQEIIYDLHRQREKYDAKIKKLFSIPVVIDSPLAISATEVFRRNLDCFDEEAREYVKNGDNPLDFPGLQFTRTADESRALNERTDNMIIISASGMCDAGRIKHHLKHNLWKKNATILFVGYQAVGTLGRRLIEGAKKVKIFGEDISVNARIEEIDGFSGHADMDGLLDWIGKFNTKPKKIFIVHGEEEVMNDFSKTIEQKFNIATIIPSKGDSFVVEANKAIESLEKVPEPEIKKKLNVLELLESLKVEFEEMTEAVKVDVKQKSNEQGMEAISAKLKDLEKMIKGT